MYIVTKVYNREITSYAYDDYYDAYKSMKEEYLAACEKENVDLDENLQNKEFSCITPNMASISSYHGYDWKVERF